MLKDCNCFSLQIDICIKSALGQKLQIFTEKATKTGNGIINACVGTRNSDENRTFNSQGMNFDLFIISTQN